MPNFILMLTRDDVTVADAHELLDEVLETEVMHVGFKDVGLPPPRMLRLVERLRDAGRVVHLEVVSLSRDEELRSARVALDLGVDYLIGGTRWRDVADVLSGSGICYFPYPGRVYDHPAKLSGSAEEIAADAEAIAGYADGINLLAYRHVSMDGIQLLADVLRRVRVPVIAAGSINSLARVGDVVATGVWGFTIGAAALDGALVSGDLRDQITAVLDAATLAGHNDGKGG
jgi:hypothetical protein